ncbi:MAG TPA: hypothetical protein DCL09_03490 [Sutterella sp.]|nr:hypothetical protein [Sutterella sp.]
MQDRLRFVRFSGTEFPRTPLACGVFLKKEQGGICLLKKGSRMPLRLQHYRHGDDCRRYFPGEPQAVGNILVPAAVPVCLSELETVGLRPEIKLAGCFKSIRPFVLSICKAAAEAYS